MSDIFVKLPPETTTEAGLIYSGGWTHEIAGEVYWHREVISQSRAGRMSRSRPVPLTKGWSGKLTVRRSARRDWRTGEYDFQAQCVLERRSGSEVEATATFQVSLPADRDAAQAVCEAWAERVPEAFLPVVEARRAAASLESEIDRTVTRAAKEASTTA